MIDRLTGALTCILPALNVGHLYQGGKIQTGKPLDQFATGCNDADC